MKKMIIKTLATATTFVLEALRSAVRRPVMGIIAGMTIAIQFVLATRLPICRQLSWYGIFIGLAALAVFTLAKVRDGNVSMHEIADYVTKKDKIVAQFDMGYSKPTETIILVSNNLKIAIGGLAAVLSCTLFGLSEWDKLVSYFTEYHAARHMLHAQYLAEQSALQWGMLCFLSIVGTTIVCCDAAEIALLAMESNCSKIKVVRSTSAMLDANLDIEQLEEIPVIPFCGSYREISAILDEKGAKDSKDEDSKHKRMIETYKNLIAYKFDHPECEIEIPQSIMRELHPYVEALRAEYAAKERRDQISHRRVS